MKDKGQKSSVETLAGLLRCLRCLQKTLWMFPIPGNLLSFDREKYKLLLPSDFSVTAQRH